MKRYQVKSALFTLCSLYLTFAVGCADEVNIYEDGGVTQKIIGGEVVNNAPDNVAVLIREVYDDAGQYRGLSAFCTGALIHNSNLLTAAHCVENLVSAVQEGQVFACFGESEWYARRQGLCPKGQMAQIVDVTIHPEYDANFANDIAVAKLGGNFNRLEKAKLPKGSSEVNGSTTSYGYGLKKTPVFEFDQQEQEWERIKQGKRDNKLRRLETETINTNECNQKLNELGHRSINNNELCIKVSRRNNLCEGDSGGPTFINGKLVGVSSRVYSELQGTTYKKCGGKGPTVLTNVKAFRSWIRRQVR
ncbi:MAG: hypothetical protein CMH49_01985 [Myxococcales bacterium]|nr:hypothetical protein [Myxococcales bacterium]